MHLLSFISKCTEDIICNHLTNLQIFVPDQLSFLPFSAIRQSIILQKIYFFQHVTKIWPEKLNLETSRDLPWSV